MTAHTKPRAFRPVRVLCIAASIVIGGAGCTVTKDTAAGATVPAGDVSTPPTSPSTDPTNTPTPTTGPPSPVTPVQTTPTSMIVATSIPVVQAAPLLTPVPAPADDGSVEPVTVLGTIEIPKIGINEPLYEGIRLTTFDRGPGHWPGTAMPGQFGNAVVGGHRTSHSRPFRHLDALVPGDEVIFTTMNERFVYQVESTEIVTPDVTRVVNQNPGFTATLFACHPLGSTRERIVVHLIMSAQ